MIIPGIIAGALLFTAQAPQTRIENVPLGRINVPDEIAPAILPYLDCMMASRGVRSGPPGPNQEAPPPEQLGANCSQLRESSRRRAENVLRDQRRGSASERRAYVERVLAGVDRFAAAIPMPGERLESKPDAQD